MDDGEITWEQQAGIYQDALETALAYQHDLEDQIKGLESTILFFQKEILDLNFRHEDTLLQRDQVIIKQEKEIAHISHILQIQQRLLRTRQRDAK